jgi:ribose/xylose/arabinose/galactoside ABC-type transport system permease subunit
VAVACIVGLLVVVLITKLSAKAIIATLIVGGIAVWGATGGVFDISRQTGDQVTEWNTDTAVSPDFK